MATAFAWPIHEDLKREFTKREFGEDFIDAAKRELPFIFGRMAVLEEYFTLSRNGGDPDRMPMLIDQLGTPREFHGSRLRKLWKVIWG